MLQTGPIGRQTQLRNGGANVDPVASPIVGSPKLQFRGCSIACRTTA
jgi:hypothetical protein